MKLSLLLLASLTLPALADQRGDTPGTLPSTPQKQLAKFHVPPGFEVQLVAAEPDIQKPINLNFDAAGRLWITGSELYPWPARTDPNGQPIPDFDKGWAGIVENFKVGDAPQPAAVGRDSVRVLSDFGENGRARKITLFADKLSIPSGVQPLPHGSAAITEVYGLPPPFDPDPEMRKRGPIAERHLGKFPKGETAIVYSIPNIWLMADWDGDGFAESRVPLYTGFGFTDTHGGSSSYIYWIDGWIYGTHGFKNHSEVRDRLGHVTVLDSGNTYRFRPDGTAFEIYAHGQTNPFGLAFDPLGNLFSADSHSKPVYMLLRGGYYEGIGKTHDGLGFAPAITDDDHGSSAIAGIAYYADDKWPEEYRGNLFNGNPVTQRINRDRLEWHGSTPKAIRMPDFLTCDDPWFRPVNLRLGPDGALYIADFYNPIIGHYEVPLTHPARDRTHGRIWRVVWRGEKAGARRNGDAAAPRVVSGRVGVPPAESSASPEGLSVATDGLYVAKESSGKMPEPAGRMPTLPEMPDLTQFHASALAEKLADPSLEVRRLAVNELVDRVGGEAADLLKTTLQDSESSKLKAKRYSPAEVENAAGPALSALDRLGKLPDDWLHGAVGGSSGAAVFFATKILAERGFGTDAEGRKLVLGHLQNNIGEPERRIKRAIIELLGLHTAPGNVEKLVFRCTPDAPEAKEDLAMIYAAKLALRNNLAAPGGFVEARRVFEDSPWGREIRMEAATIYADISLAIPTADSAAFLLAHLERTKLETPRAGEFLKHAMLHLPAEKLDAVVKLVGQVGEAPLPKRLAVAEALGSAARQRQFALPEEIEAWSQRAILEALGSGDAALARQGVDAARDGNFEAKLEPLAAIVRDTKRTEALRVAALEAVANLPASRALLAETLADPRNFKLRKRASELLVAGGFAEILAALPGAPFDLAQSMAGDLIEKGDDGCRAFLDLVEAGQASPRLLRNRTLEMLLGKRAPDLQARAAALTRDLPPEDERLGKVIAQRTRDFAKATPDAARGAQVFQQNCAVCHRFRGEGGNVGPNLDGVVTRGPARLIEDILDPNRNVDPGFRQTIIETHDGQMFAGANVREQGGVVLLIDAAGQELSIAASTIKTRTLSPLSLMPPAFETQLAAADFHDLLAFLLSETK